MTLPILLALAGACAIPEVNIPFDSDMDGLMDDEEADIGTDPDNPDSDGDQWDDGDEVASNTDPLDPEDHLYQGGWPIDSCRDDIAGEGWTVGQIAAGFSYLDQFGDSFKLHDFCAHPVMLTFQAFS